MALLRNESAGRFDPLMFEILDELGERLDATQADLTKRTSSVEPVGRARLLQGERDLRTLYSIDRAAQLPIGRHERLTLIAGLLRTIVPFAQVQVDVPGGETFHYGDRESGIHDRTVALSDGPENVGVLKLTDNGLSDPQLERLDRVATMIATMIVRDRQQRIEETLTDTVTGLPNARFLRRALDQRIPSAGQAAPAFGLIAVHVRRLGQLERRYGRGWTERYLSSVARRLAGACNEHETLARLGPDQFIVLTGESGGGELVRRWHALVDDVTRPALDLDGQSEEIHLDAAHAAYPVDGDRFEALLATLEARLTGPAACVVPFPKSRVG
jgi:diguanylate cyclase (GGDEF)-like protein